MLLYTVPAARAARAVFSHTASNHWSLLQLHCKR